MNKTTVAILSALTGATVNAHFAARHRQRMSEIFEKTSYEIGNEASKIGFRHGYHAGQQEERLRRVTQDLN